MMIKDLLECLHDWKGLWDDPRGPGKLIIVGTTIILVLFFNLVIIVISKGRWGIY